jgi:hypothetical protein
MDSFGDWKGRSMQTGELTYRPTSSHSSHDPHMAQVTSSNGHYPDSLTHPALHKFKGKGLIWGLGGTILSVIGFVALALFEQYNGMLTELRNDLKHFNETSSEFVKKENVQRYRDEMKTCTKEIQASSAARTLLEQELRASEKTRDEMAHELQHMRERLAFLEGRQTASPPSTSAKRSDE